MTENVDWYLNNVVNKGNEDSKLLNKLTAPSLKNCSYSDVIREGMNGIAVLKNLPMDHDVIVYSIGGDPKISDLARYTDSMVYRLAGIAELNGITPLALTDVVDASIGDKKDIITIGNTLRSSADTFKLAVVNGELSIQGFMVNCIANINGTMIGLIPKSRVSKDSNIRKGLLKYYFGEFVQCATFSHDGYPVYANSDGQGTKSEFNIRTGSHENALLDVAAMQWDDLIKIGATGMVSSNVLQTKGNIPVDKMRFFANVISEKYGIRYIIEQEYVDERIMGYKKDAPAFNLSGSSVSIVDEKRLKNPLMPHEGEHLIAARGKINPRSNGITSPRMIMIDIFGKDYHNTKIGKIFLEYLAAPSIIFYPYFKELIDNDLATSVYHMSGGAYEGKLAKPLAKHNLFVSIDDLFLPDWRAMAIAEMSHTSMEEAYAKWSMGNDAFVTTNNPKEVIEYFASQGLNARKVGIIEKSKDGKTGVELTAYNGEKVYYSGKEKKS